MRNAIQLLLTIFTFILFNACNTNDDNLQLENTSQRSFIFHYGEKSYKVDYKIESGSLKLLSKLPKELNDLKKNKNLSIKFLDSKNLYLVDKNALRSSKDPDFADYANFYKPFGLEKVNHYGFVVSDQKKAQKDYTEQFNTKNCWYRPQLTKKQYSINGADVDYNVDLVFGFSDEKQYEILESNTNGNGIFGEFLQQKEGLHHIGFGVDDLEATNVIFNQKGYETILSGDFKTKMGLVSKISFFDTRKDIGAYTEVVEAKLLGFTVDQNEALYNFGLLLGDVKLDCID